MSQNLASSADEQGLRQAIAERPDSSQAHAALASFLCTAGRAEDALAHITEQVCRLPSSIWPLSIKAGILSAERRATEAIDVHRALVAAAPDVPLLWMNFASDLAAVGETAEAGAAYRKAIKLSPGLGAAWLGLANLHIAPSVRADIAVMQQALSVAGDPYQKVQLHFALGRAYGDVAAFAHSFENYREANLLRATHVPFDGQRLAEFVQAHRRLPASFFDRQQENADSASAIFIVGMPRSGSTLVEHMLASHSEIEGCGELFALNETAAAAGAFGSPGDYIDRLRTMPQDEAERLAKQYFEAAGRYRRTNRAYFIDKMPSNWRFTALVHRILPDARIVDVRRDPMACCFSGYTTYFNRHTDFPNELEDLGRYYRRYAQMMDIMQNLSPSRIHRVKYEQLVSDTEREMRALLNFLKLPWSSACLNAQNSRAIYTPSAQQVRGPIRPMGDRWRDYMNCSSLCMPLCTLRARANRP